jgi:hypothetical protein
MLRRIMSRILDGIETIIHCLDALTDRPSPWNKFDTSNRPAVDPKTVPYRTQPPRPAGPWDR